MEIILENVCVPNANKRCFFLAYTPQTYSESVNFCISVMRTYFYHVSNQFRIHPVNAIPERVRRMNAPITHDREFKIQNRFDASLDL